MSSNLKSSLPAPEPSVPPLLVVIDLSAGCISVHGELDRSQVHRLAEAVSVLTHSPSPCWTIDVSGVTFCDAEGLRGLLGAQVFAARSDRRLSVTRPSPWLRRLMHLTRLHLLESRAPAGTSPVASA